MNRDVLAFCRQYDLLQPGDQVICAVSGGADSMALLGCLLQLRDTLSISVSALHCNHHLRGAESDEDAAFVAEFCRSHGVALQICDLDVTGFQAQSGCSLEDAARQCRYAAFDRCPAGAKIATAHTADDNLETVLIHLVRGASLRSLGGIPVQRGRIIRPLLGITRSQVLSFLQTYNIPHREDHTNASDFCLRNRLRHHVTPQLLAENPALPRAVTALGQTLRQEDDYLSRQAAQAAQSCALPGGFSCQKVLTLDPALKDRVLYHFLTDFGVPSPQAVHMRDLRAMLQKPSGSRLSLPGGITLQRSFDCIGPVPTQAAAFPQTPLQIPGNTHLPALGIKIAACIVSEPHEIENTATTFTIKYDMIAGKPIYLRPRQRGDYLVLPGGSRSLKRLFIDQKIPAPQRSRIPVLADAKHVLAVCGFGVSRDCAAHTAPALKIQIEPEPSL